ncbi:MAG: GIY-YIG nuclease family protein, partial [Bdellovibrionales bacterium]
PRIKIKDYNSRDELKRPGVYILFGKNEKDEDAAYIGEAEIGIDRLQQQLNEKEFWNETIIFNSKDKYLNKASIKYLEHRMYAAAISAARYEVNNGNTPPKPEISEAEQAELEEFLYNIKILTATLGHRIFEELKETIEITGKKEVIFFCKSGNGADATGTVSTEGFVVFKDSIFVANNQASMHEGYRRQKEKLIQDGILVPFNENYKLQKHITFSSSSRAAQIVQGRSASGPIEWKTQEGIPLKQFE